MSVSNIAIGAHLAGNAAVKARHGMNEAIARLSTGNRAMYGGDAAGHGAGIQFRAEGKSAYVAARGAEDGISFLQAAESALFEMAALNTRLRELSVQSKSGLLGAGEAAAIAAEETAIAAAGNAIDAATLNGKALLTAAIAFITKSDGTTTTLGTAAGVTLAADASDAQTALIQDALGDVAAGIASLKGHSGALYALAANAEAAAARMMDTDFAMSSAQLAKFTVLNQSAMAMVAQANQANSALLSVLQ
jgi:flagellin